MNNTNENINSNKDNRPYDLTMIRAICENNPDFFGQLIQVFADTTAKDNELLKETAAKGDWREAGQLVHKMKSSINHFQVASLKDVISKLEYYQNSSPEELHLQVLEFDRIINSVLSNLKEEFPEILNS
jgi:HPt (histidine-containing phosphotransfer) domain-containing protein